VTISGYNGGFGNVDRWLGARGKQPLDLWVEDIPFGQTRHYTKRVLTTMWIYRWLYGTGEDRILAVPQKLPPPSGR
jgi:soluble lytic murein transglycosylase